MMPACSEILAAVFRRCEMWTMITRTIPVVIIIIIIIIISWRWQTAAAGGGRVELGLPLLLHEAWWVYCIESLDPFGQLTVAMLRTKVNVNMP